jgi:hypothetical protein
VRVGEEYATVGPHYTVIIPADTPHAWGNNGPDGPGCCGLLGGLILSGIRRIWTDSRRKRLRDGEVFCPTPDFAPSPRGRGSADRPLAEPHALHDWRTPPVDVDGDARKVASPFRGQERDHIAGLMGFAEPAQRHAAGFHSLGV